METFRDMTHTYESQALRDFFAQIVYALSKVI